MTSSLLIYKRIVILFEGGEPCERNCDSRTEQTDISETNQTRLGVRGGAEELVPIFVKLDYDIETDAQQPLIYNILALALLSLRFVNRATGQRRTENNANHSRSRALVTRESR